MGDSAEGHTASGATPSGTGPAAGQGTSTPGATGTKSLEELQRDGESMRKSITDLTTIKGQQEARIKELETLNASYQSGGAEDEEYLTAGKAKALVTTSITDWWKGQQEAAAEATAFQQERQAWLDRAAQDIPESKDPDSPVFKKAAELWADPKEGLTRQVNGQTLLVSANADYVAFSRAKSLLGGSTTDQRAGAEFASAGGPSGGAPAGGSSKLSDEEFLKLSPEERAAYQERQFQETHGVRP